jgi:arylsulfatase A-like enzyme
MPQTLGWRTAQFCEYGNARMVCTDRHKLIVRYPPHAPRFSDELYDLHDDPRETQNLIEDPGYAEIRHTLQAALDAHFARYEEPDASGREILARPMHNPHEPWRIAVLDG